MNTITKLTMSCTAAALLAIPLAGCTTNNADTEGNRTIKRASQLEEAGEMQVKGERMVREGEAMIARGETMKKQGDEIEGEGMITKGKLMVEDGNRTIDQAKAMRPKN